MPNPDDLTPEMHALLAERERRFEADQRRWLAAQFESLTTALTDEEIAALDREDPAE
jgi:hypothetical protein